MDEALTLLLTYHSGEKREVLCEPAHLKRGVRYELNGISPSRVDVSGDTENISHGLMNWLLCTLHPEYGEGIYLNGLQFHYGQEVV